MAKEVKIMSILSKRVVTLTVIHAGLLVAAFPTFFPDSTDETVRIFVVIGCLVSFGALVWSWIVLRCPHCGAMLPLRGWADVYCPNCGKKAGKR